MKKRLFNFNIYRNRNIFLLLIIVSVFLFLFFNFLNNYNESIIDDYIRISDEDTTKNNISESLKSGDTSSYLKNVRDSNNDTLAQGISEEYGITKYFLTNENNFISYLLDNNIESQSLLSGIYNQIQDINGTSCMYYMFKWVLPLLIPIITMLLMLKSIYAEKESYNFLMTLPAKKENIIKAKIYASVSTSIFVSIVLIIIAFLIGVFFGGIGDFRYPIALNSMLLNTQYSESYLPLYIFILVGIVAIIIKIILYTGISLFIGVSIKNKWISYLLVIVLGLAPICYFLFLNEPLYANTTTILIPFIYDSCYSIITYGYSQYLIIGYYILLVAIIVVSLKESIRKFKE